ncbi:unnamed protein product (macronuclear) [Paramecium tetraurelia]|uniref:Chromosome undetermined scaffold_84, whole genome shotgun sequence n=1 Tax=Paramecium tetraurelia TaxID=5888 RepID=Q3SD91_PARTE|nr:uncharacterized protein GSPATT00024569001 [Paramecium tetraurelia]CAI44474.1 Cytosol-type hsp70 [Paramecium tetraurelia]CAK91838.1 unnamed protein product [Paramecium tetraurelia]|eukprot:XP_001459235.1 hypothetical protein (macronuclear) [Paramecium tetraurelia strain d4-2]
MKQQSEIAIGIDLGLKYSRVGVMINDQFELIANEFGNKFTPSYVAFVDNEILIGEAALNQQAKNPTNTIYNVMRLMGRRFSDKIVQEEIQNLLFKVESDEHDRPKIVVQQKQEQLRLHPEEVCSMILSKMKTAAEIHLGHKVNQAVITTSCNLNFCSKRAIEDAGLISGLRILRIIIDSTAAYFAYGMNLQNINLRTILIFNLGGGSITVSAGDIEFSIIEITSTSGNRNLGGEEFDNLLVNHCCQMFQQQYGIDLRQNARAMSRLKIQCQKSKETLSSVNQTTIEVEFIAQDKNLSIQITRETFEMICQDLFKRCISYVEEVLKEGCLTQNSLNQIILVGGSSRIPKIQELLKEYFNGKQLYNSIDKDEAAVLGAAFMGALLKKQSQKCGEWLLIDVTPYNLGIGINGQYEYYLIKKNVHIPVMGQQKIKIQQAYKKKLEVLLYEGDISYNKENQRKLGHFNIDTDNIEQQGEITISFLIDGNHQLVISTEGQQKRNVVVQFESVTLQDEEIQRLIEESEREKNNQEIVRQKKEAKNKFESLIYNYKRLILDEFARQEEWLESHQDEDPQIYIHKIEDLELKFQHHVELIKQVDFKNQKHPYI